MNYIIKMIKAIEGNVDITNEAWYEIVNYYSITQLILRSHAGRTIFAIPINQCEETADTYEFSQSCTGYNAAMYSLKKSDLVSVSAEYCEAANSLIMKCELNSGVELCLFVVNESFMGKQLSDFREMDIYNLHDFMEEVINNENEFCCVSVRVTDIYGLDIKLNPKRVYVNTLDDDWKLHISDDFNSFEVPITDDSINEFYIKDNETAKEIIVKPYGQSFMEISLLFFKKRN
mgnify:FL=1